MAAIVGAALLADLVLELGRPDVALLAADLVLEFAARGERRRPRRSSTRVPAAVVAKKWAVAWGLDETERTVIAYLGSPRPIFPTSS